MKVFVISTLLTFSSLAVASIPTGTVYEKTANNVCVKVPHAVALFNWRNLAIEQLPLMGITQTYFFEKPQLRDLSPQNGDVLDLKVFEPGNYPNGTPMDLFASAVIISAKHDLWRLRVSQTPLTNSPGETYVWDGFLLGRGFLTGYPPKTLGCPELIKYLSN